MPIVNFSIPKTLDRRVARAITQKGFASKAEFFRFAAFHFLDATGGARPANEDARFAQLTDALDKEIVANYRGKKIPPLRDQLADL